MAENYVGSGTSAAGGAGNESYIELWNPAASGVQLKVTSISVVSADSEVKIKYHTAKQGTTGLTKGNKILGGLAPSAELYGNNAGSVLGTQIGSFFLTADALRIIHQELMSDPIVIDPGHSLILENATANTAITSCEIHWTEKQLS